MIVAYVPDLMDRSKVAGAVPGVQFVNAPSDLAEAAASADVVLVDLARPGAIEAVTALPAGGGLRIVGFAPHVDHATLDRARVAGCTEVLARREPFRHLAEVLDPPVAGGGP